MVETVQFPIHSSVIRTDPNMNPQIEKQLSELELKHALHQTKMDDQHEDKHRRREWHRNPNRRRSVPPICLV